MTTVLFSWNCSQQDQDRAKARAHEMAEQSKRDAQALGHDARHAASEISEKTKSALNEADVRVDGSTSAAEKKLRHAGTVARDAATTAQVKSKLLAEVGLQPASEIHVDSSENVVTLRGEVSSSEQKQAAEKAALSVDGVTRVVNQLQVK